MAIISQNIRDNQECEGRISNFLKQYGIGKLLAKCGAGKEKGICIVAIFRYLMCLMFSDRSMYMQIATGRFAEGYSKNTVYRFLNSCKTTVIRLSFGMTQATFAEAIGVSVKTVEAWEAGTNKPIGIARRFLSVIKSDPEIFTKSNIVTA